MSDLLQAVKGTALSVAEFFTPVLKQSKFKQTGVLTPDEFIMAGDHLVHHCPTWSWSGAADPTYQRPYLPSDKQYLLTKSVPCYKRCKDIEYCSSDEKIVLENDGDGGWVDTHHSTLANVSEMVDEMTIHDLDYNKESNKPLVKDSRLDFREHENMKDEDDGEAEDMDQFLNMVDEEDDAVADFRPAQETKSSQPSSSDKIGADDETNIVPTRTYDLNITYDKYYQTPRLWLVGYDENHKPLTIDEMYEDISQDHAKKTVTMETHPHIPTIMASVHPCRHAEVMKKVISTAEDGGRELQVYSYLIVFLKFVQSVIPTIEYDYTQNFTM